MAKFILLTQLNNSALAINIENIVTIQPTTEHNNVIAIITDVNGNIWKVKQNLQDVLKLLKEG